VLAARGQYAADADGHGSLIARAVLVGMLQRGGEVRGAHCESAMASSGCVVSGAVTSAEAMHVQYCTGEVVNNERVKL